jgi:hypothetical protein
LEAAEGNSMKGGLLSDSIPTTSGQRRLRTLVAKAVPLVLGLALSPGPACLASETYELVAEWPSDGWYIDSNGSELFIVNGDASRVSRLTLEGTLLAEWPTGVTGTPSASVPPRMGVVSCR